LCTQIKRWHDLGKSGWMSLINLIPGVSIIVPFWLGAAAGEDSQNRYGQQPTYTSLLAYPQAWAFAIGKFLTDAMWWFYMSWFPNFLHDRHNLDLIHIGLPLVVVYVLADIGSIAGGWMSSVMIKAGFSINTSRKLAMLIPALGVVPIIFAQQVSGMWSAVLLMGLATSSHQAFSSNLYTLVSDMFPKRAVGSIAGFGGMFGYFGAAIFQPIVGHLVEEKNNYLIPFICAGSAYLLALGVIHLLAPRMEPAIIDDAGVAPI
jgi:MFS transporter, ACS family, hexuronate transporter